MGWSRGEPLLSEKLGVTEQDPEFCTEDSLNSVAGKAGSASGLSLGP